MTNHPDDDFDWNAAEADVVDLSAARQRRARPTDDVDSVDDTLATPDIDDDDDSPHQDHDTKPQLVDSVDVQRRRRFTLSGIRDAERRPIVPPWLLSRAEFFSNLVYAVRVGLHKVAFQCSRVPKYAVKLLWRSPRGLGRVVLGYNRWLWDAEGEPVRQSIVRASINRPEEARTYERLTAKRDRRVRWRGGVTAVLAVLLLISVGLLFAAPSWMRWSILATVVAILGVVGTPADKPLLDTAVVMHSAQPLTSEEVIRALSVLNIAGINRALKAGDNGKRWFPAPISRENGTGWRADIELPRGVTATEVVEKREELASALARPLGCVWPEANAEIHPGRLVLFVADKDMSRAKQKPWPLLKNGTVDLFKPFAFGTDPRGRIVTVTLMFASMIIGSIPRMGKTFALRLVLLAASLDSRAWLLAFDLKGTGDLSALEPIAHRYRAGDDDEDIEYAIAVMREMRTELRRRTKVIRSLPRDVCPENKVTPELASAKAHGLQPIVIGVDECQVWFEHPKYGDEFEEICVDLVKRGPAAGISLILATQRPDAKSIPTGVSANAVLRFCLKVMGWRENDMVLGDGQHGNGIKATMFSRRDRGIGFLAGEGDDPAIARAFYIDGPTAERIVSRARTAREKAGTITGHAAGHKVDTTSVRRDTILEDTAAVMTIEPKLWTEVIVERLAALRPELYAGMTREQLTAALKPWGVVTKQTWGSDPETGEGANRRGFLRDDILKAITQRDGKAGG